MPNTFAYIAFYGFPLVAIWIFRRNSVHVAIITTVILAYLLLPGRINLDLPLLPPLNKETIVSLSVLALCMAAVSRQKALIRQGRAATQQTSDMGRWLPRSMLLRGMLLLYLIFPILTVFSNSDGYVVGGRYLPGLRIYDAFSVALLSTMSLLPFFVARRFLGRTEDHIKILKILCICMAGYGVLALIEVRLSPQINTWVYGYFPHTFVQHIRAGGFRPLVFLDHGLILGLLLSMALLSAVGLWRALGGKAPGYLLFAIPWLFVVLVLSKTLGPLMIFLLLAPVILCFGMRVQLFVAALIAALVLLYPMLRGADLVPTQKILEVAENINPARADSLSVRLSNEDRLLAHANARPVLGWGGWGRSRIYDEWTGQDITITDGWWVIEIGVGGWLGYLTRFGLLALPLILLAWRRRSLELSMATSVLCIVQAANLIDLLPNAALTPITWLMTGALWGRYELGRETADQPAEDDTANVPGSPYRRQLGPLKTRHSGQGTRSSNGLMTRRRL